MTKSLRVLVGCETSGVVRRAFNNLGHDAWSVDLLPAEDRSNRHYVGDVRDYLDMGWDLLAVMHPPCTRLCNSGVRWLNEPPGDLGGTYTKETRTWFRALSREEKLKFLWNDLDRAADLFNACWNAPIERVAVENPVMHPHGKQRIQNWVKPQIVQPWHFGEPFFKATGLYLRNLPELEPTNKLTPPKAGTPEHRQWSAVHLASPGEDRWKIRSRTFEGVAKAMAAQWGGYAAEQEFAKVG